MNPTMVTSSLPGWQSACFTSVLALAFTLYHRLLHDSGSVLKDTLKLEAEYDFVVIGGGSAGAVVANRLSEMGHWTVLLLEAGDQQNDFSQVPSLANSLRDSDFDWKFRSKPPQNEQSYCLAMTNHSCKWPRGKVVGGSSVLNSMLYVRGNKNDYDNWEREGNTGWGYNNVLKYFLKSEDNNNKQLLQTPYHSSGGYLSVQDVPYRTPLVDVFLRGGECLGYKNVDVNGEHQAGFMMPQGTLRHGSRCSTQKAFVEPVQKRPNLSLLMASFVTKIGFEYESSMPTARTVTFIKDNQIYTVRAKKEVVLSAGSVSSPQILMLSGIGPKNHLEELGIKVVKDLNVGYNLQDHVGSGLQFKVDKKAILNNATLHSPDAILQYLLEGKGPLTTLGGWEGTAFLNSKYANQSGSYPDIQFQCTPQAIVYNGADKGAGVHMYNFRPDLFEGTEYEHMQDEGYFSIMAMLLRPESRGRIMLRSQNPFDHPIIEPNYFAVRKDLDVLVDGMKLILDLCSTPPFKEVNTAPIMIPFPGCEGLVMFSDEYIECLIRHFTLTIYHPTTTCKMGVGPDAVVDPRLRVYGVRGLRIVDASIMPAVVSGNTNAPSIMVGEKGSDLIKEDWKTGYVVSKDTPLQGVGSYYPFTQPRRAEAVSGTSYRVKNSPVQSGVSSNGNWARYGGQSRAKSYLR